MFWTSVSISSEHQTNPSPASSAPISFLTTSPSVMEKMKVRIIRLILSSSSLGRLMESMGLKEVKKDVAFPMVPRHSSSNPVIR